MSMASQEAAVKELDLGGRVGGGRQDRWSPGLAIALALRVLAFQLLITIPSSSMEPGLVTGDYVVISKWPYGWSRASIPFNLPLFPWTHGQAPGRPRAGARRRDRCSAGRPIPARR